MRRIVAIDRQYLLTTVQYPDDWTNAQLTAQIESLLESNQFTPQPDADQLWHVEIWPAPPDDDWPVHLDLTQQASTSPQMAPDATQAPNP